MRYGAKTGYLYYTSTAQKVFMRVPVDPATLEASGTPEFVAAIDNADDFCLDEDAGFAYVARHRASTLHRAPLAPAAAARYATCSATRSAPSSPEPPAPAGAATPATRDGRCT